MSLEPAAARAAPPFPPAGAPEPASALLTDLYELTMLQACFDEGLHGRASFELFSRRLPAGRNFLLAAGLEQVLQWLESLHFREDEIAWLAGMGRCSDAFLDALLGLQDEPGPGEPLLAPVMRNGQRTGVAPSLAASRAHAQAQLAALPVALRSLGPAPPYPVAISPRLRELAEQVNGRAA